MNEFWGLLLGVIALGFLIKLIIGLSSPPAELTVDRKRKLILQEIKPIRSQGHPDPQESNWATLLDRYKLSYALSQQNEKVSFDFGHEQVRATSGVISSAAKNVKYLEELCLTEFQIDLKQLAVGNKELADLRKVFQRKNL